MHGVGSPMILSLFQRKMMVVQFCYSVCFLVCPVGCSTGVENRR